MKFVDGTKAKSEIRKLLVDAKHIRIAVSYWGDGAVDALEIQRLNGRDIKIVCDLLSGACNPDEINKLRDVFGSDCVRKLAKLHAKVWIIDNHVILGSSNASTNGLTQEGREAEGLVEANVLVSDKESSSASFRAGVSHWFQDNIWRSATKITEHDMELARERWKIQRKTRPSPKHRTLLEALKVDPDIMKGKDVVIYAWPYHELDEAGKQGLEEERKDRDDDEIYCWDVTGMNDFEVPVGPGAYVIEFDLQSNGVPRSTGVVLSRILEENHMRTREDRKLLFCKIVKRIDGLSLGNIAAWQSAIARAVKSDGADGTLIIEVGAFARRYLT